jgi:hypothetical protein
LLFEQESRDQESTQNEERIETYGAARNDKKRAYRDENFNVRSKDNQYCDSTEAVKTRYSAKHPHFGISLVA